MSRCLVVFNGHVLYMSRCLVVFILYASMSSVVQGTLGCAVSNAAACAVPSHEVFIRDTNNFMLYIGDRGLSLIHISEPTRR